MEFVKTSIDGQLATVHFSRGDARNALSTQAMRELRDTARALQDEAYVSVVLLHGDSPFSAGADLRDPEAARLSQAPFAERRSLARLGCDMCEAWERLEAYTVLAIEGYCIGGAAALAATADYRVLGRSAYFRLPEMMLGINLGWQSIPRLVAQIGAARTKQAIILAESIMAEDALNWGLCEAVVDDGQALSAARELAQRAAAAPPVTVRMTKESVNAAATALARTASHMDRDQFLLTTTTGDFQEGCSAFVERRDPRFKGD